MRRKRREGESSALSFMDCICCGFGAVLLLFIITAKQQIIDLTDESTTVETSIEELQAAKTAAEQRLSELDGLLTSMEESTLEAFATPFSELAAKVESLSRRLEITEEEKTRLQTASEETLAPAGLDRPSADARYLSGLNLQGPRILILLTNSGSMLGEDSQRALAALRSGPGATSEKWERAKAVVRSVMAGIPKGAQVALYQMNTDTAPIFRSPNNPWFDPYDNAALLDALRALDALEANGGHDLAKALFTAGEMNPPPSSILMVVDGLPTAPARGGSLTEADRVDLFERALAVMPPIRTNAVLLPFAGDPSAAGLYWRITARTSGVVIAPDPSWPPQ